MSKPKPLKGRCDVEGCKRRGGEKFECIACIELAAAGKLEGKAFSRKPCIDHRDAAIAAMKRHVLVKHPANILRVAVAALKGEEL